jgi:hypothetical protein
MRQGKVESALKASEPAQGRLAAKEKASVSAAPGFQFTHWANACRMTVF